MLLLWVLMCADVLFKLKAYSLKLLLTKFPLLGSCGGGVEARLENYC